jgi:FkbM family methyltransferase
VIGKRTSTDLRWVLQQKETYLAVLRALWVLESPFSLIRDEVISRSLRRHEVSLRTPVGRVQVHLMGPVDLSTVFGVFCRADYQMGNQLKVAVDIGANIGIASLYFLSRNSTAHVYAYEPVPRNTKQLLANIAPFGTRCEISPVAVGTTSGTVDFGIEPTGKFGGIKVASTERISVSCVAINDLLESVLTKHSEIDCLKIDVEGTERETLAAIAREFWSRIGRVYAENCNCSDFLPKNFRRSLRYNVERLERNQA